MANLFNGFLSSNGKIPLSSVKDKSNWLSEPPIGDYVGILNEQYCQIDFDTEEDAKIAMDIVLEYKLKCDILKTTRGIHLYFKDTGRIQSQCVGHFNAIGLQCDIGLGSKNRVVPIRVTKEVENMRITNGVAERTTEWVTTQREFIQTYDELEDLPAFFHPMGSIDHGLKTTTTRNDTLFKYILFLQSRGFNKEEIRRIIKLINKYVLYEPLGEREIDTITRDDAFSHELFFGEKNVFLHDRFGDYMLSNCNIMNVEGQMCIYTKDNLYSNDTDEFERVMISKIGHLKDAQRKEVFKYISLKCNRKGEYSSPKLIGLRDSILDIETMEEFPYSPQYIINNKLDLQYNPHAYSEVMDKTLDKVACNDPQIRALLEEMIGYTLYRENTMQVCFFLTGEGSNGKSTILNVIKKLLGRQNYTSLDMKDLEDTFRPAELYGKLANIGDDISAKYLEDSSVFKKVVTGESITVAKKYGQPFELESYAKQIFSANQLPQVADKSDGFSRRIILVPFQARFSKADHDYDPFIEDKLLTEESLQYLLKVSIEGIKRVLFNRGFTKSDKGESEKHEYIKSNNNVLNWLDDNPKIKNEAVGDVYLVYQVWCTQNGYKPVGVRNFSQEVRRVAKLVSKPRYINGKSIRVYVDENEMEEC